MPKTETPTPAQLDHALRVAENVSTGGLCSCLMPEQHIWLVHGRAVVGQVHRPHCEFWAAVQRNLAELDVDLAESPV